MPITGVGWSTREDASEKRGGSVLLAIAGLRASRYPQPREDSVWIIFMLVSKCGFLRGLHLLSIKVLPVYGEEIGSMTTEGSKINWLLHMMNEKWRTAELWKKSKKNLWSVITEEGRGSLRTNPRRTIKERRKLQRKDNRMNRHNQAERLKVRMAFSLNDRHHLEDSWPWPAQRVVSSSNPVWALQFQDGWLSALPMKCACKIGFSESEYQPIWIRIAVRGRTT